MVWRISTRRFMLPSEQILLSRNLRKRHQRSTRGKYHWYFWESLSILLMNVHLHIHLSINFVIWFRSSGFGPISGLVVYSSYSFFFYVVCAHCLLWHLEYLVWTSGNLDLLFADCRMFLRAFPLFRRYNLKKLTYEERKAKLVARLQALNSAADDEDEDDEWKFIIDRV